MKRIALSVIVLVLAASMLLVSCGGGSKKSAKGDTVEVTWWVSRGEDSTYYMSYEDNPGIKYLETLDFGGKKIDFKFLVPVSGSERDQDPEDDQTEHRSSDEGLNSLRKAYRLLLRQEGDVVGLAEVVGLAL